MKGLISGIKKMEIHDGDGIRTTVFFKGCPLKCVWCHNPESISFKKEVAFFKDKCAHCGACKKTVNFETATICPTNAQIIYGEEYDAKELAELLAKDKEFFDISGGGVTMSGGECLAQPEFAIELAKELKSRKISVFIDTCGFVKREVYEKILPYADAFLYDIKAFDESVHIRCTGQSNKIIKENLEFLVSKGARIDIRYPLVKGYNDGEVHAIGRYLSDKNIHEIKVLKYHNFSGSRYLALGKENTLPDTVTTDDDMRFAVEVLKGYGLNLSY